MPQARRACGLGFQMLGTEAALFKSPAGGTWSGQAPMRHPGPPASLEALLRGPSCPPKPRAATAPGLSSQTLSQGDRGPEAKEGSFWGAFLALGSEEIERAGKDLSPRRAGQLL